MSVRRAIRVFHSSLIAHPVDSDAPLVYVCILARRAVVYVRSQRALEGMCVIACDNE